MKTDGRQMLQQERRIEEKLDKITSLLETLVQIQEDYPPESKMKKTFLKRAEKLLAELRDGRLKMHTYKNFADFDKSIG